MQNEKFGNGTKGTEFVDTSSASESIFEGKSLAPKDSSNKVNTEKITAALGAGKRKNDLEKKSYVQILQEGHVTLIPVEEYLNREAEKLGFESYEVMREKGLSITTPPLVDRQSNPVNLAENESSSFLTVNSGAFEKMPKKAMEKEENRSQSPGELPDLAQGTKTEILQSTHIQLSATNKEIRAGEIADPKKEEPFTVMSTVQFQNTDIIYLKSNDYLKKSPVYGHFRKTAA